MADKNNDYRRFSETEYINKKGISHFPNQVPDNPMS